MVDFDNLRQNVVDMYARQILCSLKWNGWLFISEWVCMFQTDYHNLIGITADLVDSLEATVQGRPVSSIQDIIFTARNEVVAR